jgi:AcrR family transcriptional regulator
MSWEVKFELLWRTRERPARGPKPALTLDQIVDAAIAVADANGVEGLSMRCVAKELGVGTMSLYRYVPGKGDLLDLILDKVSDPSTDVEKAKGAGWREALRIAAHGTRRLYLNHPWLLQINWTRPVFGPNTLAGVEFVIGTLGDLGLTDQERVSVLMTIDSYVTGMTRTEIQHASAAEETGISDEEFWRQQLPLLEKAMETGDYPVMAVMSEDAFDAGWDETFEFGLERLLDGLESFIASRTPE